MSPDPSTSWSSCAYCRCRFPTTDITQWIDGPGGTPLCPRCGVDTVMPGAKTDAELEQQHVHGFGGLTLLLNALRSAHVPVDGYGLGLLEVATSLEITPCSTIVVLVGGHQIEVVVDPPGRDTEYWRIRVPTKVCVRHGDADPGRAASRIDDAGVAHALRSAGFALALASAPVHAGPEGYRAIWEHRARDARSTASAIKSISDLETTVVSEPDDGFWRSMGDLRSMRELADRLADLGTAKVTPWALTLRAADGRELAVIDSEGHGTLKVCLVLAAGSGAKAARRRSESVLAWFDREAAHTWREHGFTHARRCGVAVVLHGGEHRWAVVIDLSFDVDDCVEAKLRWARDHGIVAFPLSA